MLSSSMPLSAACWATSLGKLWPKKSDSDRPAKTMRCLRIETRFWRENAVEESLKSGVFDGRGSCMNSLCKAVIRHICYPVAAKIICTLM